MQLARYVPTQLPGPQLQLASQPATSQLPSSQVASSQIKFEFIREQHSPVSSCLIRLNQVFIDSLASQPRLNHVFKSFVSYTRRGYLTRLTVTVVWNNLLQSILQLSSQKQMEINPGPPAKNNLFYLWSLDTFGQDPRYLLLSNFLLPRYLSNRYYDDVPSSFLLLLVCCQQF